jgi:hypothetical protein
MIRTLIRRLFARPSALSVPVTVTQPWSPDDLPPDEPRAFAPHCDSAVLHAPGECEHCDKYPDWQEYRKVSRIAFTGHDPVDDSGLALARCPSEQRRSIVAINRWPGNRPKPAV